MPATRNVATEKHCYVLKYKLDNFTAVERILES